MGSRFSIQPPGDYVLARDACSYGYFLLAPNRWSPIDRAFSRLFDLEQGPAMLTIAQPAALPAQRGMWRGKGSPLTVVSDRALARRERAEATRQISRMLRLDEQSLAEFHRVDPRWKASGRGRIFRSPTLFEDVVKTVTSCNVTWPGTIRMNQRLCDVVNPAFPRPEQLARRRPASLRTRCGVGYRDVRLVELGRLFTSGAADPDWFEDATLPDEEIRRALLELPGVGPYAAANIMQLLGRYSRLAIDTESVKHGREALGFEGKPREVEKAVSAHYERFGAHRFRSYWLEMWTRYERRSGPAWTWSADGAGASLTALDAEA